MDRDEELADHERRIKQLEAEVEEFKKFFRSLAPKKKQEPERDRENGTPEPLPRWAQVTGGIRFPLEPGDDPEQVAAFWRDVRDGDLAPPQPDPGDS